MRNNINKISNNIPRDVLCRLTKYGISHFKTTRINVDEKVNRSNDENYLDKIFSECGIDLTDRFFYLKSNDYILTEIDDPYKILNFVKSVTILYHLDERVSKLVVIHI